MFSSFLKKKKKKRILLSDEEVVQFLAPHEVTMLAWSKRLKRNAF